MAKELSDIPLAGTLTGAEEILIVQGGNSRRLALSTLAQWVITRESIIPSSLPWRGAKVGRSATVTGVTFPHIVAWDTEIADTDGFWSAGTPTRFTIPAGITKVELGAQVALETGVLAGGIYVNIRKNGADMSPATPFTIRSGSSGYNDNTVVCRTWPEDVVAGDYFEVRANTTMSGVDQVLLSSRFWLTVIEAI